MSYPTLSDTTVKGDVITTASNPEELYVSEDREKAKSHLEDAAGNRFDDPAIHRLVSDSEKRLDRIPVLSPVIGKENAHRTNRLLRYSTVLAQRAVLDKAPKIIQKAPSTIINKLNDFRESLDDVLTNCLGGEYFQELYQKFQENSTPSYRNRLEKHDEGPKLGSG
jgi:hypothetical protein